MKSMMKKTTVREIFHSFGRFMAILAITGLGVGFFSGVRVTTPAMVNMMNHFLRDKQLFDYRLLSTVGWEAENVSYFAGQNGVKAAEGGITLDVIYQLPSGEEAVLKTHLLPQQINGIQLSSGRLPENGSECVADYKSGLRTGDVLRLSDENAEDTADKLAGSEYTVVGLAESSYYINFERGTTSVGNGSVQGFVYLPQEGFDTDVYTELFIRFDRDDKIYSSQYERFIEQHADTWKTLAQQQADSRAVQVTADARQDIEDGRAELESKRADGEEELEQARQKLNRSENKLNTAKRKLKKSDTELRDGQKKLDETKKTLDDGQKELDKAKEELDESKAVLDASDAELRSSEQELKDARAELDALYDKLAEQGEAIEAGYAELEEKEQAFYQQNAAALAVIDTLPPAQQTALREAEAALIAAREELDNSIDQVNAGWAEYTAHQEELDKQSEPLTAAKAAYLDGLRAYQQGEQAYKDSLAEFEAGKKEYEDAVKKLEDGKKEYKKGLQEYEDGLRALEDGRAELEESRETFNQEIADAEQKLADAEQKLTDLATPEAFVLDRNTNIGYACFENDSEIVAQVAKVFPIFFILVAALVCMTTMSRMIEEQRVQIGVLKALGYSEQTIMRKYTVYSGCAALTGCVLGFALGTWLFPAIIWTTYKLMYIPLSLPYLFDIRLALAAIVVSLVCSVGTTWLCCRRVLAESAANLMRPKAPKAGKRVFLERIPLIWKRLKFLHKVSVRNILRYKGRFFMMIAGIGGCTALLLTGFGIKDSIAGFAQTQYEQIQTADAMLVCRQEHAEDVEQLLREQADGYVMMQRGAWDLLYDGGKVKSIDLEAISDFSGMDAFMQFRTEKGAVLPAPQKDEALISHSIAARYGAKTGDEITLRDESMRELHLKVAGVFENHVYNYVFISMETYSSQLSETAAPNGAYLNLPDGTSKKQAAAAISGDENVTSLSLFEDTKVRLSNMMSSLDYIVLLVIVCAAGLAFIVIYNLTNINITERTREIATIKVLGFFRRETSAYVLRENLALTSIGVLLGLGLGVLLHRFVMAQIVVDMIDFRVQILPISFVYSVILTFVFNFIVNLFMEIKLERINMAESLKSVD